MNILFIIPARGGSKGVRRKNIRKVGGHPLIWYKITAAKKTIYEKRIIVSTDDNEISLIAQKFGAEVPFMRPSHLSNDTADSMAVVSHAIEWIENNSNVIYNYICLLEPSSPFMPGEWLNDAVNKLYMSNADSMLGMKKVNINRVFINTLDKNGGLSHFYEESLKLKSTRRQDQIEEYTMNGCFYIVKYEYFKKNKTFHSINSLPYIMPNDYSLEIDNEEDLEYANYLIEKGKIDLKYWEQ